MGILDKFLKPNQPENQDNEFSKAYDQYADDIFRHCYYRVYDREKAKELMQECFMKTWQYLAKGKQIEHLRTFLYRVANNLIIDYVRRKKESSLDQLQEIGFEPKVDEAPAIYAKADTNALIKMLDQLEPNYRQVILMRYVDDLDTKEIAQAIGETENTVYVRMHRGLKQLKELFNYERPI